MTTSAPARPVTDFSRGKQRLAQLSPTGDKVAFVRDNNIYNSELATGEETTVTTDGKFNHIINHNSHSNCNSNCNSDQNPNPNLGPNRSVIYHKQVR